MKKEGTKKKVKRRLRWQGVIFLASICVFIYLAINIVMNIRVRAIKISGNEYVKDSQIIKSAGFTEEVKFLGFKAKEVCSKIMEDPLISSCKIERKIDFKVEIIVEESKPLFFYSKEDAIVLSDGKRIEGANTYGLPTLVNFAPEEVLDEFISGLSKIDSDIIASISEIEYSPTIAQNGTYIDKERFVFDMNDGNTVIINNRKMPVFNHYKKVYASIDKKGIYNFDCDFDNYLFSEYEE